ncbi:MAG: hypothetical protein IKC77_03245 [Lentisphaeria bacterium]|nr:hypothetical protein [Lentisphaeria bacterium]
MSPNSAPAPKNMATQQSQNRFSRMMTLVCCQSSCKSSGAELSGYGCFGFSFQRKPTEASKVSKPIRAIVTRQLTPQVSKPPTSTTAAAIPTDQKECPILTYRSGASECIS